MLSILTVIPIMIFIWLSISFYLYRMLVTHLNGLSNVIESLRIGDYSMRIAAQDDNSAWGQVYNELNKMANAHQENRIHELESDILLDKLLAEFDVPVFIFDRQSILQNCNDKGCHLFLKEKQSLVGLSTWQLKVDRLLNNKSGSIVDHWFPKQGGKWELRKNFFVQNGQRFSLVLLNDLSRTLREEERSAWNRLIRVIGHELNNSLASLMSVSETLVSRLKEDKNDAWLAQYKKALTLIHDRSASLMRFTASYTRLAKLPEPKKQLIDLQDTFNTLINLVEGNFVVNKQAKVTLLADPDQFGQLLINLMKNAVEASSLESKVLIRWQEYENGIRIQILDSGIGLPASDNLFVPFFTTKDSGEGIGLFLCRQIVEAHEGSLRLSNRDNQKGCIAECWFPASPQK